MDNVNESKAVIDIRKLVFQLKKYWFVIIGFITIGLMSGYLICVEAITPVYSASADMIVNNRSGTSDTEVLSSSDVTAASSLADTYAIILKSHVVLEGVIEKLSLPYSYSDLSKRVSINSVNGTQVMRITVKDEDVQRAVDIVTCIIDVAPKTIMEVVEAGSVRTVDNPWTSGKPVYPDPVKGAAIGGMAGLLIITLIIFILEGRNHTIRTEEDIDKLLGLHVIGTIPVEEIAK